MCRILLYLLLLISVTLAEISPRKLIADDDDTIVISIRDGEIRGNIFQTVGQSKPYYAFRGIPFAEPPIGDLRFEPPVPVSPWMDIKNTTEDAEMCVQNGLLPVGSEDCLYLSVYAPVQTTKKLPVMVWVHGGGFLLGSAPYASYAPDYLLDQDVIFVALQYRVGIFGFLSTGDMVLPGNGALKDQILALKWVQDNIGYFGGDAENVTLFGQSAGSAAVSYLIQSPLTEGLFHKAILESGTSLCIWSLSRYPKNFVRKIAEELKLNINPLDSKRLVDELKTFDPYLLQWVSIALSGVFLLNDLNNGFYFAPVIEPEHDEAVFTELSYEQLTSGNFNRIPTIIGFNSQEGIMFSWYIVDLLAALYELDISRFPPADLGITDSEIGKEVGLKIHEFYFGNDSILNLPQINTTQYITDHEFVRPISQTVLLQSRHAPVYFYKFSYEGELGGDVNQTLPGVSHGDELAYLFRHDRETSETDVLVRSRMVSLWTNFAKFSNPTPQEDVLLGNIIWPVASQSQNGGLSYIEVLEDLNVGEDPNKETVEFWNNIYENYGQPPFDTY